MPILQKSVRSDFTTVHNAFLRDKNLGINARGLLVTMLSMADGWNFSIKGLASILPDGEYKISSTLRELTECGYLVRKKIRTKGMIVDWEYNFSDEPIFLEKDGDENAEDPDMEESDVKKPDVENQDVVNRDVENLDVENRGAYQITNNQIPKKEISKDKSINRSIRGSADEDRIDMMDLQTEREEYLELLKNNIEWDWWTDSAKTDLYIKSKLPTVKELLSVMLDVVCSSKPTIRINGEEKPTDVVKSVYLKLRQPHIEFVVDSLEKISSEIKNPRAYMITALYNAFSTYNYATQADVNRLLNRDYPGFLGQRKESP